MRPERQLTAIAYSLSGLFDGIVNCGAALGGAPTQQAGLKELCRYVLLVYHYQTTASHPLSSSSPSSQHDGTMTSSSTAQDDEEGGGGRHRLLMDLGHVSSTTMSLVSHTVLSALIPTLKGHRRIAALAKQIYGRLAEDVIATTNDDDIVAAVPRTAVPLSTFKTFLTEVLQVTTAASLQSASSQHSAQSSEAVRVIIPTSTGETSMDCFVPTAHDVIHSVVAGECRALRVPKHKLVPQQEFTGWLFHAAALLCTVPGGHRERGLVSEVELLLTSVMLPAARRVGHVPLSAQPDADPYELLEAATATHQHRRPSPRSTHKAVDGSDSRAWIASRVPAMLSRPKPQPELDGSGKGLNDAESIEGLQHVLRPAKQNSGSNEHQTLEAKLAQQGALRLIDAYPMKLKHQPLVVQPPPPAPQHRRR